MVKYLMYPESTFLQNWDPFITLVLIYSCVETPYRIAFSDENAEGDIWNVISIIVDFLFLFDIVFIFNTAYYDEDFKIIEDRKTIARHYLQTWFLIDLVGILPFDLFSSGS